METAIIISKPQALTGWADVPDVIKYFAYNTPYADVRPATRSLNKRILTMFFEWVRETGRVISDLTIADLIAYKEELLHVGNTIERLREPGKVLQPLSPLTVASYINSIRHFFEWTESIKIYPNIAKGLKTPKRIEDEFLRQPLQVAQVGNLLKYEQANQSPRDYAIINLLVRTGLRTVEVVRANVGDITYIGNQRVLKLRGKGRDGKDNFVILTDAAYLPILEYLNARPDGREPGAPLFTSESNSNGGERLTTRTISKIARKGLDAIGLNNRAFTAHSLRHTAGTNILRAGGTLEQAQMSLRHSNPATTERYVKMALKERRFTEGGEFVLDKLYNNL